MQVFFSYFQNPLIFDKHESESPVSDEKKMKKSITLIENNS